MNCPVCKSPDVKEFSRYPRFALLICGECDLVYRERIEGVDVESLIAEIYDSGWSAMRDPYAHGTFVEFALFHATLIDIFKPVKGALLEIGSGTGEFLYTARAAGWETTGVEPSAASCAYAKEKYGLDFVHGTWSPERFEGRQYDVITFWHVLEHIADPVTFLREMAGVLKPDGLIFLSVPNKGSFTNEICGPASALYTEIDHLYHYSKDNIRLLFDAANLEPLSVFSRQAPHRIEFDINLSAAMGRTDKYASLPMQERMALIAELQGRFAGHELFCVLRAKQPAAR